MQFQGSEGGEKCKSTAKEVNSQPELRQWAATLQREEAQLSKIPLASEPGSHPHSQALDASSKMPLFRPPCVCRQSNTATSVGKMLTSPGLPYTLLV